MQQFVPCDGCGNHVPIPEILEGQPAPLFLSCEACGNNVHRDIDFTTADSIQYEESSLSLKPRAVSQSTIEWSLPGLAMPRRKPQEASAIRKIVPPVLGGLAAFPIATLIMWYGFGKDIGSTGPTVAQYVPWIVPQKLRGNYWENSSFDAERPNSTNPQSSGPSTHPPPSFPTLNREYSGGDTTETPGKKDEFQSQENIATISSLSKPVDNTVNPKPRISETIAQVRTLQTDWSNTPKSDRVKMVGDYNSAITQLSEQAAGLKGRSATNWRKELETIARDILAHPKVPTVIQLGPIGGLPGVPVASHGDFIATVVKIGAENEPAPNDSWSLRETWSTGQVEIPIEIMPGAWRTGAATLPRTCLLFGRLVANEASQRDIVLKVHAVLPQ